jgi:peptidyl-prolyl cis-trans isomerase C
MTHRTLSSLACALALVAAPVLAQQPVLPKPGAGAPVLPPATKGAPAATQNASRTVTVNGKPIPRARVDALVKQQVAQGRPDTPQLRDLVMTELVNREVAVQEAEKRGLSKDPEVQTQMDLARQQVLIQALLREHFVKSPISDKAMRAEYEKLRTQRGDKEYRARHVLVENESEAREIIAQLGKGAKFQDLAKQSKDPGSRDKGGDLDWNSPATFVKPFADALSRLEKGKYTEQPVRSQFGWHVIQLDDVRPMNFPSFDQVKPQIQNMMQEQEVQKVFADLRNKAKIEQ